MVIPDDFTILTGDMKLEHLSTLHTLNELKRNLKRGENKEPSHHLYTATLVYSLKKKKNKKKSQTHAVSTGSVADSSNPLSKLVVAG